MKSIAWTAYGPPEVLQLVEVEKPVPKENEILIRNHFTTVSAGDCEMRRFDFPNYLWLPMRFFMGLFKPAGKTLGQEFAGVVEAVGGEVTQYKVGDQLFGSTGFKFGGYAEYVSLPVTNFIKPIPQNMTMKEAVTIQVGAINGYYFLKKAETRPGEKILINGAGGSIGTYALQIAKHYGLEVTCVDSGQKLNMLKDLGADHIIDYKKEDFTQSEMKYDAIIDIVGIFHYSRTIEALKENGRLILGNPRLGPILRGKITKLSSTKRVIPALADYKDEDYKAIKELIEGGLIKAVIDRSFSLEEIVAAHRYVESGEKAGNLIVEI